MNVSKGDLARIIEAQFPENLKRIVTVKDACTCFPNSWEVHSPHGLKRKVIFDITAIKCDACVPDRCLRRICPPPDQMVPDPVEETDKTPEKLGS